MGGLCHLHFFLTQYFNFSGKEQSGNREGNFEQDIARNVNSQVRRVEEASSQFHQPTGVKRKCAGTQHFAHKDAAQFHQQNCAQLFWSIELENTPNFYAVRSAPYAGKLGVNVLAQKLLVK